MAKANRVIQKPKPPAVKHMAIIDPNTGVISGYASGTNIVLGIVELQRNWQDVTDLIGGKHLSGKFNKVIIKDGKIKKKPVVQLVVDSKKVKLGKKIKVSWEVVGSEAFLPEEIEFSIKNKKEKLKKNQHLELMNVVEDVITLKITDPKVYSPDRVTVIFTDVEPVVAPPDTLVIEKK